MCTVCCTECPAQHPGESQSPEWTFLVKGSDDWDQPEGDRPRAGEKEEFLISGFLNGR